MPTTTSRLALVNPVGADAASELRVAATATNAILDNATIFLKGTFASIPAAGSTASGTIYYATDTVQYFVCDGTAWQLWSLGQSGSSIIATSQSLTSTSYATLTTPDQVTGLVLPASGLISVWYQATWQESVAGAARAAIFIGANQLVVASDAASPRTQAAAASAGATTATNHPIASCAFGLVSHPNVAYGGDATTGQALAIAPDGASAVSYDLGGSLFLAGGNNGSTLAAASYGGPCSVFAAAGTYTVSVKFKASSGSVTASNRRLYVKVVPF